MNYHIGCEFYLPTVGYSNGRYFYKIKKYSIVRIDNKNDVLIYWYEPVDKIANVTYALKATQKFLTEKTTKTFCEATTRIKKKLNKGECCYGCS